MSTWIWIHMGLAYLTAAGFVLRAAWSFFAPHLLKVKPVRILPHVVDTLLLISGLTMALSAGYSLTSGWLAAKLLALLAYIGFGVLTLRGSTTPMKLVGISGALASLAYLFSVAMTRDASPWG